MNSIDFRHLEFPGQMKMTFYSGIRITSVAFKKRPIGVPFPHSDSVGNYKLENTVGSSDVCITVEIH